jgi:hypothetical protein
MTWYNNPMQHAKFLTLTLIGLVAGCAHRDLPVGATWPTHQQLISYSERALAAMKSHESIRLQSGGYAGVIGEYDTTKPIRYWMENTKRETLVYVQIPTKSGSSYSRTFEIITFNGSSDEIVNVGSVIIH